MDQRRIELRIIYLKRQIAVMDHEKTKATDVGQIRRYEDSVLKTQGAIAELKQWTRELDLDPGYGKLIRSGDGSRKIKLPMFESREERAAALENRAGTATLSESDIRRAREFRAREDGEVSVRNMDGRSPYVSEEERKPPRGTI